MPSSLNGFPSIEPPSRVTFAACRYPARWRDECRITECEKDLFTRPRPRRARRDRRRRGTRRWRRGAACRGVCPIPSWRRIWRRGSWPSLRPDRTADTGLRECLVTRAPTADGANRADADTDDGVGRCLACSASAEKCCKPRPIFSNAIGPAGNELN